jgi:hypothetical protein
MEASAAGIGAGVLAPLWDVIAAEGDVTKAYPDELLSVSQYTKGKINPGDLLDSSNVDLVKDLLDDVSYIQIAQQGRIVEIKETTTDVYRLNPPNYIEATLSNKGKGMFDAKGNVVTTDGQPWIGGNPFPDAKTAAEVLAGHTLSWGRQDVHTYGVYETDLNSDGEEEYHYEFLWVEVAATTRHTMEPKPYFPGHEDKLRFNTALFTYPNDVKGTSLLNIWPYDQTQYPDFFGFLPAFKRVRRFPTNQRFEPVIAGSTFFITDAWMTGDPFLTWGNFKLVSRGPMLGCANDSWNYSHENWLHKRDGGKTGKKFCRVAMELIPEAFVVDLEPTGYPRSPYSKKRIWFDARTLTPMVMNSYDRRGQVWKQWEGSFDTYDHDGHVFDAGQGYPYWSWTHVHSHDIQNDRISVIEHCKEIVGGYGNVVNDPGIYEEFCTKAAIRRLGT